MHRHYILRGPVLSRIWRATYALPLVVIAVMTAELAARLDDWIRMGIPLAHTPDENHDLKYQDWFGVRGRSNGRYRRWQLDNYGFRGPDITRTPRPGCTRIMLLGASETFGLYESENKEYAAQLRDTLQTRGCYEVVNAGIAGAGLQSLIRLWENYGAQFTPAIVLVYPSPTFYLGETAPAWRPMPGRAETPHELPFRPRLIDQLHNVWATPAPIQRLRIKRWIAQDTAGKPASWFFRQPPQDRLDQFMGDLDSLVTSIRTRGAQPVLMTHAMRPSVPPRPTDANVLLDWQQFNPRATTDALLGFERDAAQRMRDDAQGRGTCLVDLDHVLSGRPEYFADFAHFTDLGAAVVAGAIARTIADGPHQSPRDPCSLANQIGTDGSKAGAGARLDQGGSGRSEGRVK